MIKFLIDKFFIGRFRKKIYTNDVYWIKGCIRNNFVVGRIVRSEYPMLYMVGKRVKFSLYHLPKDIEPRFKEVLNEF